MKNLLLYLGLLLTFFISCKNQEDMPLASKAQQIRVDTVFVERNNCSDIQKQFDSLNALTQKSVEISIKQKKTIDSLNVSNNVLGKKLLHERQILENARYYLRIVNKNPSQQKFLRGWMNRALNQ